MDVIPSIESSCPVCQARYCIHVTVQIPWIRVGLLLRSKPICRQRRLPTPSQFCSRTQYSSICVIRQFSTNAFISVPWDMSILSLNQTYETTEQRLKSDSKEFMNVLLLYQSLNSSVAQQYQHWKYRPALPCSSSKIYSPNSGGAVDYL